MIENAFSCLIYTNVFSKIFRKERVDVDSEAKRIKLRQNYDVYSEENLRVMHIVCKNGIWNLKFLKDTGVPCFIKFATVNTKKNHPR